MSPKGNYIVAAVFPEGEEKYRILWDRGAGKVVEQFPGSPLYHSRQAISPDEFVLAYSADDYSIVLWNIPQRRETSVLNGHTWHLYGLEFAPVSRLLASFDWDGFCRLWDVGEGKPADPHILRGHLSGISYAAFSADGRTIATRADDDSARFWSVATGQELLSQRSEPLSHPLISPQGDRLVGLTAEGGERNIRVVTLPSLSEIDAMISRENRQ